MAYNKRQKLQANYDAIELAFRLERENRSATEAEMDVLRRYSGFGGLKFILNPVVGDTAIESWSKGDQPYFDDTVRLHQLLRDYSRDEREYQRYVSSLSNSVLTSFYTPSPVVDVLTRYFKNKGVDVKTFLDPSSGRGTFIDSFRDEYGNQSEVTAFEKDLLTGKILKALHPDSKVIVDGFETMDLSLKGRFDLVASNIPFGDIPVFDPDFARGGNKTRLQASKSIHNYFFLKALDAAREGGFVAFITSRGFMDSPSNNPVREEIARHAVLVAALRLPDGMFSDEAGTEVGSDLVILQKHSGYNYEGDPEMLAFTETSTANEDMDKELQGLTINTYWWQQMFMEDPFIGKLGKGKDPYGKPAAIVTHEGTVEDVAKTLEKAFTSYYPLADSYIRYFNDHSPQRQQAAQPVRQAKPKRQQADSSQPVQLSLFDLFDEMERQEQELQAQKPVFEPRPYSSEILPHHREGMFVEDAGQLGLLSQVNVNPTFTPADLDERDTAILLGYIKIRDSYEALYRAEADERVEHPELRDSLNYHYDNFVTTFGELNSKDVRKVIRMDVAGLDMLSLENAENGQFVKSDIFRHPVAFVVNDIDHVETADEALSLSLNQSGGVDLDYMEGLTGLSADALARELKGRIFYNPATDGYEYADKFLAGNVIEKRDLLRSYASRFPDDARISESLAAVEKIVPAPIPFEDLDFNLGERWIPTDIYSEFVSHFFDTDAAVTYTAAADDFSISVSDRWSSKITTEYAVKGDYKNYDGLDLLQHAFLNTSPTIMKCIGTDADGKDIKAPDLEKIQLANSKIDEMRDAFTDFLNGKPRDFKDSLADTYNRKFNCFVRPKYDGSHLMLGDLDRQAIAAPKFGIQDVYKSQKDCVWMLLQNGGGICDHEVGTGKTLIMCMAAHEMHRLGVANKPLIIGLKANVAEIAATYQAAYPNDRILYASEKDYSPANRKAFFNKIKNNDYACVIMSHDQFGMIPQSLEIQRDILQEEIYDLEEALDVLRQQGSKVSGRMKTGLEKRKETLRVRMADILKSINDRTDDMVDFKQMGIDHIFVDESHQFKNLMFNTRHDRVAGLGNSAGSKKALNLLFAIRTIQERTGRDLGATFLSGTTISNSLTELYLLFKYLRPKALEAQNIGCFDAWAAIYTKKTRDYEFSVTNAVILKERFRYFIKVPELAMFYNEITDYRTGEDVGIDRPAMNVLFHNIKPTADQQDFNQRLTEFAKTGNGELIFRPVLSDREKKGKMLIATDASRKASLDMRLIGDQFGDDPDNKASHCASLVNDYYRKYDEQKGTQFIFSDLSTYKPGEWNVFSEIKRKLVEDYGIPEGEIRFIQEAKNEKQRKELIRTMNAGEVRVLMGSTSMLGKGVNAQEKAVAVHHLDIPWRPSDLEQRNGRARRKGNEVAKLYANNQVDIIIYAVERTLDNYKFNLLHNKQTFITQLKTNTLGTRTIDEGSMDEDGGMNFSEYVAILSGNTDLLEKAKLEKQILTLESERKAFAQQRRDVEFRLDFLRKEISKNETIVQNMSEDYSVFTIWQQRMTAEGVETSSGVTLYEVVENATGNHIPSPKTVEGLGERLQLLVSKQRKQPTRVGEWDVIGYGFNATDDYKQSSLPIAMMTSVKEEGILNIVETRFCVKGHYCYEFNNGRIAMQDKIAAAMSFRRAMEKVPGYIENYKGKVAIDRSRAEELERISGKEWTKEDLLKDLKEQLRELDRRIQASLDEHQDPALAEATARPPYVVKRSGRRFEVVIEQSGVPFVTDNDVRQYAHDRNGWVHQYDGKLEGSFSNHANAEWFGQLVVEVNEGRKNNTDLLLTMANGNPKDNTTMAARERLKDIGIDWLTGRPVKDSVVSSPVIGVRNAVHDASTQTEEVSLEDSDVPKITVYSSNYYDGDARILAHQVKGGYDYAVDEVSTQLSGMLASLPDVRNKYVLIPMPSSSGIATYTKRLAENAGGGRILVLDILRSEEHEPLYDYKVREGIENMPVIRYWLDGELPEGRIPLVIDNVLDTGATIAAARQAFPEDSDVRFAVFAHTDRWQGLGRGIALTTAKQLYIQREQAAKAEKEAVRQGIDNAVKYITDNYGGTDSQREDVVRLIRSAWQNPFTSLRDKAREELAGKGIDWQTGHTLIERIAANEGNSQSSMKLKDVLSPTAGAIAELKNRAPKKEPVVEQWRALTFAEIGDLTLEQSSDRLKQNEEYGHQRLTNYERQELSSDNARIHYHVFDLKQRLSRDGNASVVSPMSEEVRAAMMQMKGFIDKYGRTSYGSSMLNKKRVFPSEMRIFNAAYKEMEAVDQAFTDGRTGHMTLFFRDEDNKVWRFSVQMPRYKGEYYSNFNYAVLNGTDEDLDMMRGEAVSLSQEDVIVRDRLVSLLRGAGIPVYDDSRTGQQVLDEWLSRHEEKPDLYQTGYGTIYGFTVGGIIFIDPVVATAETPIHEYTHLWAGALRQRNRAEWDNIVDLMKVDNVLWNNVKADYPHLDNDDKIAEEVLARYSGQRGYARLMEDLHGSKDTEGLFDRMMEALGRFWNAVADFLHIHYTSKEQVADQILKDLLSQVNPLAYSHTVPISQERQTMSESFKEWFGDWENASQKQPVQVDLVKLQETFDAIKTNEGRDLFKAWYREIQESHLKALKSPEARRAGIELVVEPPITEREPEDWEIIGTSFEEMISRLGEEYRDVIDFTLDGRIIERPRVEVSKVVDEDGKPLVVEHGTHSEFNEFDISYLGRTSGDSGHYGAGFYFGTTAPAWLDNGSPDYRVMKVYLNIRTPFEMESGVKKDIYAYIKEHFDKPSLRDLVLTENGKEIALGQYIDHIKAVDNLMEENPAFVEELMAKDEELEFYRPEDRPKVWREHELSARAGFIIPGSLPYVIGEMLGSEDFSEALKKDGYDGIIVTHHYEDTDYREYIAFEPNQIKSATDNIGLFSKQNNDIRFHFIGERGAINLDVASEGMNTSFLRHAEKLDRLGRTPDTIKSDTGWEKGADGKWRFEIANPVFKDIAAVYRQELASFMESYREAASRRDEYNAIADREAEGVPSWRSVIGLTNEEAEKVSSRIAKRDHYYEMASDQRVTVMQMEETLHDGITIDLVKLVDANTPLLIAYPELASARVFFCKTLNGSGRYGSYSDSLNLITVDAGSTPEQQRKTIIHELQHAVQTFEGFAVGGNMQAISNSLKFNKDFDRFLSARLAIGNMLDRRYRLPFTVQKIERAFNNAEYVYKREWYRELLGQIDRGEVTLQDINEFARGSYNRYHSFAGEVEARNAVVRDALNGEERRHLLASATEDVPRNRQEVVLRVLSAHNVLYREGDRIADGTVFEVTGDNRVSLLVDRYPSKNQLIDAVRRQYPAYCAEWVDGEKGIRMTAWSSILVDRPVSPREEKRRIERLEKSINRAVAAVREEAARMNLDVEVLTSTKGLTDQKALSKGWFDPETGKIFVVLPNHSGREDMMHTLLHEGVAHHGLRQLFGQRFDIFLDNVYAAADTEIRERIDSSAASHDWDTHTATEEYLARLAESTDFDRAVSSGWWNKVKQFFLEMLASAGFVEKSSIILSDSDLRYVLWRSFENLVRPGVRNIPSDAVVIGIRQEQPSAPERQEQQEGEYRPTIAAESVRIKPSTIDDKSVLQALGGLAADGLLAGTEDYDSIHDLLDAYVDRWLVEKQKEDPEYYDDLLNHLTIASDGTKDYLSVKLKEQVKENGLYTEIAAESFSQEEFITKMKSLMDAFAPTARKYPLIHPYWHVWNDLLNSRKPSLAQQASILQPVTIAQRYDMLKQKHRDVLLLFRIGDFYEAYKDDAEKASKILGIMLTKSTRTKDEHGRPIVMTGFPKHSIDTYLPKLIRAGHRVAVVDESTLKKEIDSNSVEPVRQKTIQLPTRDDVTRRIEELLESQQNRDARFLNSLISLKEQEIAFIRRSIPMEQQFYDAWQNAIGTPAEQEKADRYFKYANRHSDYIIELDAARQELDALKEELEEKSVLFRMSEQEEQRMSFAHGEIITVDDFDFASEYLEDEQFKSIYNSHIGYSVTVSDFGTNDELERLQQSIFYDGQIIGLRAAESSLDAEGEPLTFREKFYIDMPVSSYDVHPDAWRDIAGVKPSVFIDTATLSFDKENDMQRFYEDYRAQIEYRKYRAERLNELGRKNPEAARAMSESLPVIIEKGKSHLIAQVDVDMAFNHYAMEGSNGLELLSDSVSSALDRASQEQRRSRERVERVRRSLQTEEQRLSKQLTDNIVALANRLPNATVTEDERRQLQQDVSLEMNDPDRKHEFESSKVTDEMHAAINFFANYHLVTERGRDLINEAIKVDSHIFRYYTEEVYDYDYDYSVGRFIEASRYPTTLTEMELDSLLAVVRHWDDSHLSRETRQKFDRSTLTSELNAARQQLDKAVFNGIILSQRERDILFAAIAFDRDGITGFAKANRYPIGQLSRVLAFDPSVKPLDQEQRPRYYAFAEEIPATVIDELKENGVTDLSSGNLERLLAYDKDSQSFAVVGIEKQPDITDNFELRRRQYDDFKKKFPDTLFLFRGGDFYEIYFSDAVKAADVLGIAVMHRNSDGRGAKPDDEYSAFPYHALDTYLPKLIRAGHRVAICDQLEDPKKIRNTVKNGITELVTPNSRMQMVDSIDAARRVLPQEALLRDRLITHMRSMGLRVITDVEEGERILNQERVALMGSRVNRRMEEIGAQLAGAELSSEEQSIVDVFSGKANKNTIPLVRNDGAVVDFEIKQGSEVKAGTKHAVYRHNNSNDSYFIADDILLIPNAIINGVRDVTGKKVTYTFSDNHVKYTVINEIRGEKESFVSFYTNRKAPLVESQNTLDNARANNDALSDAKVRQNSDISKENQENIREQRILGNNMYGYISDMNGMPLMVYHGTAIGLNRFEEFREDRPIWFTPDRDYADTYANRTERNIYRSDIRPSYIMMYHPVDVGNLDRGIDSFFTREDWLRELQDATDITIEELRRDVPDTAWLYQAVNSEAFKELMLRHGYDGIIGQERGHTSYAVFANYQIEQAAKAQLNWHLRFFRTANGDSYGFVRQDGSIYIDRRIATAETPIHEYTHLWAEVLRQRNRPEWDNIVRLMKNEHELWNKVMAQYPHLQDDDEIADEVLAQYSGKHGYERLRNEVNDKGVIERIAAALSRFWKSVADFFVIHYVSAEQVADRVMYDFTRGINPLNFSQGESFVSGLRHQFQENFDYDLDDGMDFSPVPPLGKHIDIDRSVRFIVEHSLEQQTSLRYEDGETFDDFCKRNNLLSGDYDGRLYYHQKYADRWNTIESILGDGLSRDNAKGVAKALCDLCITPYEAYSFINILNYRDQSAVLPYTDAVRAYFDEQEKEAVLRRPAVVQGLENYDVKDIEMMVKEHVQDILAEFFFEDDIYIKEVTVIGSRSRGEAKPDSDLDILLEYGGRDVREDTLFNILNAEPMEIEGIKLDINPINPLYSITTAQWLARDARWREEDYRKQNINKTMAINDNLQHLLSKVMPHEGMRFDLTTGFMADDYKHRDTSETILISSLKNTPQGYFAGEDKEGYLNISRLSSYEQDSIQKLIRKQQLVEQIGEGRSINWNGLRVGFDNNPETNNYKTAILRSLSVEHGELVFNGTVTDGDHVGEEPLTLLSLSVDGMENLYKAVSEDICRNEQSMSDLADMYQDIFRKASALKQQVSTPSSLYDTLNALSQPIEVGLVPLKGFADASMEAFYNGEFEHEALNELTQGDYLKFLGELQNCRPDQLDVLSAILVDRRAAYDYATLDSMLTGTVQYYNENLPHESVSQDLISLLNVTDGKDLLAWVNNGVTNPGERLQQLKDALATISLYDANRLITAKIQRDNTPERMAEEARQAPKTLLEGHYAMVMSYFLNNQALLTSGEKAALQPLDRVETPEELSKWASDVLTGRTLEDLAGIPETIREEASALAYAVAETNDEDLPKVIEGLHGIGLINDMHLDALVKNSLRQHEKVSDEVILYKSNGLLTAVGDDAAAISQATGWPSSLVKYGDDRSTQVLHLNSDGFEYLAEQDLNLRVTAAPVSLRPVMRYSMPDTLLALETIDYSISIAKQEPVKIEAGGSLNIGNFKAKTLDFHPTGLDAYAENGEKMVIRDIPQKYYHPEGTLVVADYINGHRETIENALSMAQPLVYEPYDSPDQVPTVYEEFNLQKQNHPDEILLLRQKGFIESFGEDAERLSKALGLPLFERRLDNGVVKFVMMNTSDYLELADNATVEVYVALPEAVDTRQAISESLVRMQENIVADAARQGVAAEIFPIGEDKYSVRIVNADTLLQVGNAVELNPDEAARYRLMVGPAAMSQRGDFVMEMADKYLGDVLRAARQDAALNSDVTYRVGESNEPRHFRITYGSDDRPGGVFGDIHVEMLNDSPRVTLEDAKALARTLGGEARMMNDRIWGDFIREADAVEFGNKMVALNVDRMVEEREAVRDVTLPNHIYSDEESIFIRKALGEELQAAFNVRFSNGDTNNTELVDAFQDYTVNNSRTAHDAVYDLASTVLNRPHYAVRLNGESMESVAEQLALQVVIKAESRLSAPQSAVTAQQPSVRQDVREETDIREAKGYMMDVLHEAKDQLGAVIDLPGTGIVIPDAPVGTEYVEGVEYVSLPNDEGVYESRFMTDNGFNVKDFNSYSDVYALTVAVREAQIKDIVASFENREINFSNPLAISRDGQGSDKDYIARVKIDDDGTLNISGHRINDDGETEALYHADDIHLKGYDELFAAVKDESLFQQREPMLAKVQAVNETGNIPYPTEDIPVVKDAAVQYLTKLNDDYYQSKGVDISAVVQNYNVTDRQDLLAVSAAVTYDIQSEAMRREWNILGRYLPEGSSQETELVRVATEAALHAESIADLRRNSLPEVLDNRIKDVNAMLEKYNSLSRASDPNFMFRPHTENYAIDRQQENEFALVDPAERKYLTSWMSAREMLAHLDGVEQQMISRFPELKPENVHILVNNNNLEDKTMPEVQQQSQNKRRDFSNYDYTRNRFPDGVQVSNIEVKRIPPKEGEQYASYQISAVIDGEEKKSMMWSNDVKAFYERDAQGNYTKRVTREMLAAKYWAKETAEKLGVPMPSQMAAQEQKPVEKTAEQQGEGQQKKPGRWENFDYTKYTLPEGANLVSAEVKVEETEDDKERHVLHTVVDVNGVQTPFIAPLYRNNVNDFKAGKVTPELLAPVLIRQQVADHMGIELPKGKSKKEQAAAMQSAVNAAEQQMKTEKKEVEKEDAARKEQNDKRQAEEMRQAEQKKEEERRQQEEDKSEGNTFLKATLLGSALLGATLYANDGKPAIWVNPDMKSAPAFWPNGYTITPFNSLLMAMNTDLRGYKTNLYTTFEKANKENISVRGKEKGIPFTWQQWDKYVNRYNSGDVIDRKAYEALSDDDKKLYKAQPTNKDIKIHNLDQTTMSAVRKEDYASLVAAHGVAEKSAEAVVGEREERANVFEQVKKNHPDTLMMFLVGNRYEIYGDDADMASRILDIPVTLANGEESKGFERSVSFSKYNWGIALGKLQESGVRVTLCNRFDPPKLQDAEKIAKANALVDKLAQSIEANGGVTVNVDMAFTQFDKETQSLNIATPHVIPGEEMSGTLEHLADAYRAAVAFTGTEERLNRVERTNLLPEDAAKYETLVQELAAGALMVREGLPASFGKDNLALYGYWERELKEDPKLIEHLERDVNNSVEVISKLQNGQKVDYAAIRGQRPAIVPVARQHTISSELATLPNADTKSVVIIRDTAAKSAWVILPSGAATDVSNEVDGLGKNAFHNVLSKEGYGNISFFNAGGSLGLNEPNTFYAGKQVEVVKLKDNVELVTVEHLDYSKEIEVSSKVEIKKVMAIKDDNNKWALYVKPANGEAFTVQGPEVSQDLSRLFAVLKTDQLPAVREELGQKYYELVQKKPELKTDILVPKVDNIDTSRISHVSINKDKERNGVIELVVTIDKDHEEKRDIDPKYWQRFWLVDDKTGFKMAVAAKVLENELSQGFRQDQALDTNQNEDREEEIVNDNDNDENVEQEQKAHRRSGRGV